MDPLLRSWLRGALRLAEIAIFGTSILVIVLCIGELAARTSLQAQIQQEIFDTSDHLARNISPTTTSAGPLVSSEAADLMMSYNELERAKENLMALKTLTARIRSLQSVGSPYNGEVQYIADVYNILLYKLPERVDDVQDRTIFWFVDPLADWIGRLNSEALLAVIVTLGGLVGALVAGFRTDAGTLHRDIPLGIAAGFVVYLAIKGGKFVFLLQTQETSFAMNPYGCVFAGLLAGLFTEKAYQLLTALIDELSRRLTNVVASDAGNGKAVPTSPAATSSPEEKKA